MFQIAVSKMVRRTNAPRRPQGTPYYDLLFTTETELQSEAVNAYKEIRAKFPAPEYKIEVYEGKLVWSDVAMDFKKWADGGTYS